MRRPLLILVVMLLAGVAAFFGGQRLVAYWCAKHMARPTDDLDWLRLEFRLNDAELGRVDGDGRGGGGARSGLVERRCAAGERGENREREG